MAEPTPEIRQLPSDPLPDGAPTPKLDASQHVEVFALGDDDKTAVTVVERREGGETRITQPWLSDPQADDLARHLVKAIRDIHLTPDRPVLLIQVDAAQAALSRALHGSAAATTAGHIMTKPVDRHTTPPPAGDVRPRAMTLDEAARFLVDTEDGFARAIMENEDSADQPTGWDRARAKSKRAMEAVVPEGAGTPGHSFLIVEDAEGEKVALLWVALGGEEPTRQSFCYNIEVEAGRRRMGYGRKTLGVWERHAAEQGAVSIGLNVFGKNLAAQKLYFGAGLTVASTLFRIEEGL